MKLTSEQQRLLEIETAKVRHAWAKAELKRAGSTPALERYVVESREGLRPLTTKKNIPDPSAVLGAFHQKIGLRSDRFSALIV